MLRTAITVAASLVATSSVGARGAETETGQCRQASQGLVIEAPSGVRIRVHTVGSGRPVVVIPSLGRGVADFDEVAGRLVAEGFMTIMPEPRGINGSIGPAPQTLFELADDTSAVIKTLCSGKVDVVGHAFGNRVARALATAHPEQVRRVVLLAGGGAVPLSEEIKLALKGSYSQGTKPDADRINDLRLAFFALGNDPSRWLSGWYPAAAEAQTVTVTGTPREQWWLAGASPILLVQAAEDPLAPSGNSEALKKDVGERLTQVTLRHASHAILPEQGAAVVAALKHYFGCRIPDEAALQAVIDTATVVPDAVAAM